MHWDAIRGKWSEYQPRIQQRFGDLTTEDLSAINGNRDELLSRLQTRYGWTREEASRNVEQFTQELR